MSLIFGLGGIFCRVLSAQHTRSKTNRSLCHRRTDCKARGPNNVDGLSALRLSQHPGLDSMLEAVKTLKNHRGAMQDTVQ